MKSKKMVTYMSIRENQCDLFSNNNTSNNNNNNNIVVVVVIVIIKSI